MVLVLGPRRKALAIRLLHRWTCLRGRQLGQGCFPRSDMDSVAGPVFVMPPEDTWCAHCWAGSPLESGNPGSRFRLSLNCEAASQLAALMGEHELIHRTQRLGCPISAALVS